MDKKKKKVIKKKRLTQDQLQRLRGGHPLCDASPKGSGHDCGPRSIFNEV